ncbi:MAG: hypothetical protein HYS83_02175 [Candidatus Blackburnbacteria bacterium]|nr:hypothetical protein [Candidatus Blackburnbacteria bacterium]
MSERLQHPLIIPEEEWILGPDDFASPPLQEIVDPLTWPKRERQAVAAVADFLGDLFWVPTVHGVAFSAIHEPRCPTTLSLGVLVELDRDTPQATNSILAIGAAEAKLVAKLSGFLPVSLMCINTRGADLATLKRQLFKHFREDPTSTFLSLALFHRD